MTTTRRRFLLAGAGLVTAACGAGDRSRPAAAPAPAPGTSPTIPPELRTTTAAPTTTAPEPAAPRFVVRGPDAPARVALTFHTDGPVDLARQLTDSLGRAGVVATCFIVGSWLDAHRSWAGELQAAGHELANHTYTHPDADGLGRARLEADITRCRDVLVRLTGSPGRFFRPSGTGDGTSAPSAAIVAAAAGAGYLDIAGFDVDPLDYRDPGAAAVTRRTLDAVRPGSIVSLHFGHAGTVGALPAILAGLRDRGLEPVTLSTLVGQA